MSEQRFDFLRELVKNVPDISVAEEAANYNELDGQSSPEDVYPDSDTPFDLSMPSTSSGRNNNNRTIPTTPKINGGQTHYQYKQTQYQLPPQNGSGSSSSSSSSSRNNTFESDVRQRIRQCIGSTQSVIMHTASVTQTQSVTNAALPPSTTSAPATLTPSTLPSTDRSAAYGNYVQPLKLMRSESSPAKSSQNMWHVAPNADRQQHVGQKRLRHQAQSVPGNNNNDNCNDVSAAKQDKRDNVKTQTHSQTAIPAPIFSYDLCNKPVVKIDYSNLPLVGNVPLSAPVTNATSYNFSDAAPIINIDLSNIVTNSGDNKIASANNKASTAAVATISIGALPADMATTVATTLSSASSKMCAAIATPPTANPPLNRSDCKIDSNNTIKEITSSSASSPSCSPSSSAASTSTNSHQGGSCKSLFKASSDIMAKMTVPGTTTLNTNCKNSNSCLELDEDYDNI
ncbi:unnamed protein product [Ceratitis capitata]|nr:unnamed protein product [Ceratitis capitata]